MVLEIMLIIRRAFDSLQEPGDGDISRKNLDERWVMGISHHEILLLSGR